MNQNKENGFHDYYAGKLSPRLIEMLKQYQSEGWVGPSLREMQERKYPLDPPHPEHLAVFREGYIPAADVAAFKSSPRLLELLKSYVVELHKTKEEWRASRHAVK